MEKDLCEMPRINPAKETLLDEDSVTRMTKITKAVSDPIRVQMLHLLSRHKDLCTCEFEEILGLSQSKVSYHLKQLFDVELIARDIHGSWSHYRLVKPEILNVLRALV